MRPWRANLRAAECTSTDHSTAADIARGLGATGCPAAPLPPAADGAGRSDAATCCCCCSMTDVSDPRTAPHRTTDRTPPPHSSHARPSHGASRVRDNNPRRPKKHTEHTRTRSAHNTHTRSSHAHIQHMHIVATQPPGSCGAPARPLGLRALNPSFGTVLLCRFA